MKYQILFSGKYQKNIINMSSAEFAHSVLSVEHQIDTLYFFHYIGCILRMFGRGSFTKQ